MWACLDCLKVSDRITSGRLGKETDPIKVLSVQEMVRGERAVFETPYEAKDAMMEVPFEDTQRRWEPVIGAWLVLPQMRKAVVRRLRRSWPVVDFVELRDEPPGSYYVGTLPTVTSKIPEQTGERIR